VYEHLQMSLNKQAIITPDFRTYGECKRSTSGAGCTATYSISDLLETTLDKISVPSAFASLSLPAGLAYRTTKQSQVCAEVDTGKRANLAGPSDNVVSDSVFDRLVSLASVDGNKPKRTGKYKSLRRSRGKSSDNKSKRREK